MSRGQFDAARLAQKLSEPSTEIVFFLGPSAAANVFLLEAHKLDWQPLFLIPGPLTGREVLAAPASLDGRIFVSCTTLPSDQTPDGVAEYRRLAEAYKLPSQHLATPLTALASAKILVEGLKRAGRDVSREQLIGALEGLYQLQTGLTPALTCNRNRRVGAWGASIVSVDLKAKTFVPVSAWIEPHSL